MEQKIIVDYINNFKQVFGGFIKPGVSISSGVSPCPEGAVIVFTLNFDKLAKDKINGLSNNMKSAFANSQLLKSTTTAENPKQTGYFFSNNRIILVKGDSDKLLSFDAYS